MPYRKNKNSTVTGIEPDTLVNIFQLGDKVTVGEHYTLRLTCSAGSKNYGSKVVPLTLVDFFIEDSRIFFVEFLALLFYLTKSKKFNSGSFALFKNLVVLIFQSNKSIDQRQIILNS